MSEISVANAERFLSVPPICSRMSATIIPVRTERVPHLAFNDGAGNEDI